ncbi:MAG TPA: hypothetical protein VLM37_11340, partial [Fibrobacteraceae bacterium]|nr:hypothetical protein [Fibrobacteraceae bacterium]
MNLKNEFRLFDLVLLMGVQASLAASSSWTGTTATSVAGGAGTETNPYQIATPEQLKLMAYAVETDSSADGYYELVDDIVWNSGDASTWSSTPPTYTWQAMGTDSMPAQITLLGNGYSISGIYIDTAACTQGLFGLLSGKVSHLTLTNSYIHGANDVGGIAGAIYRGDTAGSIDSCTNAAIVVGDSAVGGIVGYLYNGQSLVYGNVNTGAVTGSYSVGGIVGELITFYGEGGLHRCHNSGAVSGIKYVGGVVGYRSVDVAGHAALQFCYNTGAVSGTTYVGGIAGSSHLDRESSSYSGDSNHVMTNVYNRGAVSGSTYVGGIAGYYGDDWRADPVLRYAYNSGTVMGTSSVGGLAGSLAAESEGVYNFGLVTEGDSTVATAASDSLIAVLQDSLGPDFLPDTVAPLINDGYPVLAVYYPASLYNEGSGSLSDPFLIQTRDDLIRLRQHAASVASEIGEAYYLQTADIDLDSTQTWTPIPSFSGNYNGRGHQITGLRIENGDSIGLFAKVSGTVSNLIISDASVSGGDYVGIVAGYSTGTLIGCQVSGSVQGSENVGGLAGYGKDFTACTNDASVKGELYVGGIVGRDVLYG